MGERLDRVQELYSSPDPNKRSRGLTGKAIVEGVFILGLSTIILTPLALVKLYIGQIDPIATIVSGISVPVIVLGYFTRQYACNVILDLREIKDQDSD